MDSSNRKVNRLVPLRMDDATAHRELLSEMAKSINLNPELLVYIDQHLGFYSVMDFVSCIRLLRERPVDMGGYINE